jgi:hypothetical protein
MQDQRLGRWVGHQQHRLRRLLGLLPDGVECGANAGAVALGLLLRHVARFFPRLLVVQIVLLRDGMLAAPLLFHAIDWRQRQLVHGGLALAAIRARDVNRRQRLPATARQLDIALRLDGQRRGGQHRVAAHGDGRLRPHLDCFSRLAQRPQRGDRKLRRRRHRSEQRPLLTRHGGACMRLGPVPRLLPPEVSRVPPQPLAELKRRLLQRRRAAELHHHVDRRQAFA